MRAERGKKGCKSKLVPDVGPAQLDAEEVTVAEPAASLQSNEEVGALKEPAPSKSTCVGCKFPNYGLNNFIPRLEIGPRISSSNYGIKNSIRLPLDHF